MIYHHSGICYNSHCYLFTPSNPSVTTHRFPGACFVYPKKQICLEARLSVTPLATIFTGQNKFLCISKPHSPPSVTYDWGTNIDLLARKHFVTARSVVLTPIYAGWPWCCPLYTPSVTLAVTHLFLGTRVWQNFILSVLLCIMYHGLNCSFAHLIFAVYVESTYCLVASQKTMLYMLLLVLDKIRYLRGFIGPSAIQFIMLMYVACTWRHQ